MKTLFFFFFLLFYSFTFFFVIIFLQVDEQRQRRRASSDQNRRRVVMTFYLLSYDRRERAKRVTRVRGKSEATRTGKTRDIGFHCERKTDSDPVSGEISIANRNNCYDKYDFTVNSIRKAPIARTNYKLPKIKKNPADLKQL